MSDEQPVITSIAGQTGRITLNRPKALHALNQRMCDVILDTLLDWRTNDSVKIVLIDHVSGSRGFCAGGDIRMLAESGASDAREARAFFKSEYRMNAVLHGFPKPIVSLIDGITMGGGVGLSVHGSHRVATENTLFAMPETGIGLFPDVGGGWFLPRLEGELGVWLALTGYRLKGTDVVSIGVATHFAKAERLHAMVEEIENSNFDQESESILNSILEQYNEPIPEFSLRRNKELINQCFSGNDVLAMQGALESEGSEWARKQYQAIETKSPETLKVALRQLREGAKCDSFEDNMKMEYRIGWRKVQSLDFHEGVRAVIVDKDHNPEWNPRRLEDVTEADVEKYFESLGQDELTF